MGNLVIGILFGMLAAFSFWALMSPGPDEDGPCSEDCLGCVLSDLADNIGRLEAIADIRSFEMERSIEGIENAQVENIKLDREYHIAVPLADKLRHVLTQAGYVGNKE